MRNKSRKHKLYLSIVLCMILLLAVAVTTAKYVTVVDAGSFSLEVYAAPKNYVLSVDIPTKTYSKTFTVAGSITEDRKTATPLLIAPDFSVTVNNSPATVNADGTWSAEITLDGTSITVEATDNDEWSVTKQIDYSAFTVLSDNIGKIGLTGSETSVSIPATFYDSDEDKWYMVLAIGTGSDTTGVFQGNTNMTAISFPDSLESIGKFAFKGCTGITDIRIPSSVTFIGAYAFDNCSNLATATLEVPTGWKAGTLTLQESYLAQPVWVARWLRGTYKTAAWTRS